MEGMVVMTTPSDKELDDSWDAHREAKRIHSEVVETMKNAGWGLLKDGVNFYKHSYELDPYLVPTFTMTQAYFIQEILHQERTNLINQIKGELPELTLQEAVTAFDKITPEEHKRMVWVQEAYRTKVLEILERIEHE
jgi:hypothetical protein